MIHAAAVGLIWGLSLAWLRQQKILAPSAFDRSSLVTYSPEEYLPPLDTGSAPVQQAQTGEPAFARQPILSVPREADNRSQTIVVPPDLKLDHDVPLPNIVATGAIVPEVPLDATRSASNRVVAPDTHVIAPAPDADFMRNKNQMALKSDMIPPPPDIRHDRERGVAGPETAVVEPPPELTTTAKGHSGALNIGPSQVVAPAPQLTLAEQHTSASHGRGAKGGIAGGVEPVGPPPSVAASGGSGRQGRLIALGIHPVAPTGPVAVPAGNRRGSFAANPQGKPGAAGTPNVAGSKSGAFKGHGSSSLPAGLHVGAVPGQTGPIERNGKSLNGDGDGDGADGREMASLSSTGATPGQRRTAAPVSDDKVTDVDHQVFGDRRFYAMTLNMPNLNSFTGSWVIRFAELIRARSRAHCSRPSPPRNPIPVIRWN